MRVSPGEGVQVKKRLASAAAATALAGFGNVACAADTTDDSLTWFGVTLYGTVDVGYTYQTRGVPLNDYFTTGIEYLIQKNSNKKISTISENAMSQSKVGLRGIHEFYEGWSGVFKLETAFNPLSGEITDALHSMTQNNGVALANQNSNADSSRAGQVFQGAAYAGVTSPTYGTLTIGRQNSLLLDNVLKYDPLSGSYAFSVIGFSGAAGGSGATEDARLDNSIKYQNQVDWFRFGAQFQSGNGTASGGNATEFELGGDYLGLSVDATYANKHDAVTSTALSAAQVAELPKGISSNNALSGTVSDNWTASLDASYIYQAAKISVGYEDVHFRRPSHPLPVGAENIGGYVLGAVNNTAYNEHARIQQIPWAGVRYSITPQLDVFGAWYEYIQNDYNPAATCPGGNLARTSKESGSCSGRLEAYSLVADYKFNRHFDVYAGAMYSRVVDGLASGYLNNVTIDPSIGGRFNF
jgi:predicted porin